MTMTLSPHTPHKTALFTSGLLGGADLKPTMTWGKSSFGTGKKTLTVSDIAVFRSGTFRDSLGIQTTWEDTHIDQMVFNYDHLVSTKVLENVPVRKGHGSFFGDPMESLIGWHKKLSTKQHQSPVDGATYTYLIAEFEIFDEDAANHIFEGHWPNRSAEVGHYVTNAEAEHWPVYQGFAYVDIPAVEGLNAFSKAIDSSRSNVSVFMEGSTVGNSTSQQTGTQQPADPATPPADPATPPATDPATPPAAPEQPSGPAAPETPTPEGQPAPAAQTQDHGRAGGGHVFQIGDRTTTDPVEVQNYINAQNTAAFEARKQERADFVKGLAEGDTPKIAATQIDSLAEFAQGLSPEQYATWKASYESAPGLGLFGQHGADQGDNGGTPSGQSKEKTEEIEAAKVVVGMHRNRGMSEDSLKKTESYRKLNLALPAEYPL